MNFEAIYKPLISLRGGNVSYVFKFRISLDNLVFLVPSFDKIESTRSKHAIEFFIDNWVDFLLKIKFQDFRKKVNHGFEEILILEDKFRLSIT
jgi:hypothetical protein